MKELFLTHVEYSNFRTLVSGELSFDISVTNSAGVLVVYKDTAENNKLVTKLNY